MPRITVSLVIGIIFILTGISVLFRAKSVKIPDPMQRLQEQLGLGVEITPLPTPCYHVQHLLEHHGNIVCVADDADQWYLLDDY